MIGMHLIEKALTQKAQIERALTERTIPVQMSPIHLILIPNWTTVIRTWIGIQLMTVKMSFSFHLLLLR